MDDSIEAPSFVTKTALSDERREDDDDAQSSGDEDEGPDWTKLPCVYSVVNLCFCFCD